MISTAIIIVINLSAIVVLSYLLYKKMNKNSELRVVKNKTPKFNENDQYFQLEYEGTYYLFTANELDHAHERAQREKSGE